MPDIKLTAPEKVAPKITLTVNQAGGINLKIPATTVQVPLEVIERVTTLEKGQGAGVVGYATKALMDADLAHGEGVVAYVTNDPTPANNGTWLKSGTSGSGSWGQSNFDRVALVEKSTRLLLGSNLAENVPNKLPDSWQDGPFVFTSGTVTKENKGGYAALKFTTANAFRAWSVQASDFESGLLDASILLLAKDINSSARVIVRQNDGVGVEVGTRQTYNFPSSAITEPTFVEFTGVAIDPACVEIIFYIFNGTSAANIWYSLPLIAESTGSAGYRPKAVRPRVTKNEADIATNADNILVNTGRVDALERTQAFPNVLPDPFFSDLGGAWTATGAGTGIVESVGGVDSLKILLGAPYYAQFSRADVKADFFSFSAQIPEKSNDGYGRVLIIQRDVANVEITGTRQEIIITAASVAPLEVAIKDIEIHADCVYFWVWLDAVTATSVTYNLPCFVPGGDPLFRQPFYGPQADTVAALDVVFISSSGSDSNDGSEASPVATFSQAATLLGGVGKIIVRGGDYTTRLNLGEFENIVVSVYPQERARIMCGTALTGVAKTGGYAKVYQAALASAPYRFIFEHETPEAGTLIPASERHALQRGREYRLPSTRIAAVASIAAIDAASGPAWYHDGAGTLYFSAADGGDASLNTYYVPSTSAAGSHSANGAERAEINGLEVWYGATGFDMSDCASYRLVDCFAFGNNYNGVQGDYAIGEEIRCEAAANGNDGFNGHHQTTTPEATTRNGVYYRVDAWAHDNYDDGNSIHERCQETIIGGLYEYNGDRGIVPASGAHTTCHGTMTRKNGQNTRGTATTGEGFGIINTTLSGEGGVGTQLECLGCISDQDNYGFGSHALGGNIRALNCRTISAEIAAYSVQATGTMELLDCSDSGSATVKLETSGTITVSNGTIVA